MIRTRLPDHLEDFRTVCAAPRWSQSPVFSTGGDPWSGKPPQNNFAEASAHDAAANKQRIEEARTKIVSFLDGLIGLLGAETPAQKDTNWQVRKLNENARWLLNHLHEAHLKVRGASFSISHDPNGSLEFSEFRQAAQRLVERDLAKWVGLTSITTTPNGIRAVETPGDLDALLPIAHGVAGVDEANMSMTPDKKKVFVIHGRNERAVAEMGVFLRSMGLDPVWFRDVRKEMGGTAFVAKVVERGMDQAQGVLALFTPDEYAVLRPELRRAGESGEAVERWQARPNVQFEAGMAYGRDPDRVAFVLFGNAKLFSDAAGIHVFWPTNEHGPDSHRALLRGLLAGGMRCAVNLHSDDWMTAGNFDGVMAGLVGVSPLDPFRTGP